MQVYDEAPTPQKPDRLDRFRTVWSIAVIGAVCGIVATLIGLGVEVALR